MWDEVESSNVAIIKTPKKTELNSLIPENFKIKSFYISYNISYLFFVLTRRNKTPTYDVRFIAQNHI